MSVDETVELKITKDKTKNGKTASRTSFMSNKLFKELVKNVHTGDVVIDPAQLQLPDAMSVGSLFPPRYQTTIMV